MVGVTDMSDYKLMYLSLFNKVTDAIALLQEAQRAMEEICMSAKSLDLKVLDGDHSENDESES